MNPHRIRLAGPWEWQTLTQTTEESPGCEFHKCQLPFPADSGAGDRQRIQLRRRFHCPTGIGDRTNVVVALEIQNGIPEVSLNARRLAGTADTRKTEGTHSDAPIQMRFDVSGFLKPYNELQVCLIPADPDSQPILHAAAIEIVESA